MRASGVPREQEEGTASQPSGGASRLWSNIQNLLHLETVCNALRCEKNHP